MSRAALADYGHTPGAAELALLRSIVLGEAIPRSLVEGLVGGGVVADPGVARLLPGLRGHSDCASLSEAAREWIVARHRENTARYLALKARLGGLVGSLAAGGIDVLVLKGFPLATLYYPSVGARPMADLDLAVRPGQFEAARRVLAETGVAAGAAGRPARPGPGRHALVLETADGLELDLHVNVLRASRWQGADDAFWSAAVAFAAGGQVARTLCPTDHLLQACIHGLRPSDVSPVRWIVDATRIAACGPVDWGRLVEQADRHDCAGPVLACVGYLAEQFGLPVPDRQMQDLARLALSGASDRYFRLAGLGSGLSGGPWLWLGRLAADHARQQRGQAAAGGSAAGLLAMVASKLELDGWRTLPVVLRRLVRGTLRRLGRRPRTVGR